MDWAAIRVAIRSAVTTCLGLTSTPTRVRWQGSALAASWGGPTVVDLFLRSPRGLGVDETRREYDGGDDVLVASQVGQRQFTLTVKIESEDQEDGYEAVGTLSSLLRTRIRRPSILEALRAANVALVEIQTTQEMDYSAEDRRISVGVTDIVFASVENDEDTTDVGDYIIQVEAEADTLDNIDGTPILNQPSFTVDGS